MSEHKHSGHKHMKEILDGDHEASVKHRDGAAKTGVGGLAHDQSDGYAKANRTEEFKKGGSTGKC